MVLNLQKGFNVRSIERAVDSTHLRVVGDAPNEIIVTERDLFSRLGTTEPAGLQKLIRSDLGVEVELEPTDVPGENNCSLSELGTTEGDLPGHYARFIASEDSHRPRQLKIQVTPEELAELRTFGQGTTFRLAYVFKLRTIYR